MMPKILPLLTLITFSLINFSNAIADNTEINEISTDEKNILHTIDKMTTAFNNSDIEGIMATYAENATVVFEPGKPISDREVLREMFLNAFAINPKYQFSVYEVFISNDTATHITPWKMSGRTPDGVDINQSGLSVAVLRRQENGEWLIVIDDPHAQLSLSQ